MITSIFILPFSVLLPNSSRPPGALPSRTYCTNFRPVSTVTECLLPLSFRTFSAAVRRPVSTVTVFVIGLHVKMHQNLHKPSGPHFLEHGHLVLCPPVVFNAGFRRRPSWTLYAISGFSTQINLPFVLQAHKDYPNPEQNHTWNGTSLPPPAPSDTYRPDSRANCRR